MGAPAMTGFFWVEQLFENGGVAWDRPFPPPHHQSIVWGFGRQ